MTETIVIILYLGVFRLAVLALGGLCIYLGYRLFIHGVLNAATVDNAGKEHEGKLNFKWEKLEVALKGAAPGVFFAAFGMIIVVSVLAGNQPSIERLTENKAVDGSVQKSELRGKGSGESQSTLSGDAKGLHDSAWELAAQGLEALKQAQDKSPDDAGLRDSLASFYFIQGKVSDAVAEQRKAVELDANNAAFKKRLELYQQANH